MVTNRVRDSLGKIWGITHQIEVSIQLNGVNYGQMCVRLTQLLYS